MKVAVGADHAGFDLKGEIVSWLQSQGHQVSDVGAPTMEPNDDYPDFALAVADSVLAGNTERGIVVCGSGVGASITATRLKVSELASATTHTRLDRVWNTTA